MLTTHTQPTKHEAAYEIGVRDQIEARYMETITPEIERKFWNMKDGPFCNVLEAVLQCRLSIMDRHKRIRDRREAMAKRKDKRAKCKKAGSPYVDPRTLDVEPGDKILSERGRLGGIAKGKAKA